MEHVVFFPASDGSPAFRRLPSVEEAIRLVEHLRNVEGVDRVSVHALTEVPLAFRAYYRVELPSPVAPISVAPAEAEPAFAVVPAAEAPSAEVEQVPAQVEAEPVQAERPPADAELVGDWSMGSAAGGPPADAPEPMPAVALVDLPVQGGEPDPVRVPNPSLGFFA